MERTAFPIRELKFSDGDSESELLTFTGYGAVFNNLDANGDLIKPGAFTETLADSAQSGQWPAMLQQHGGWGVSADDMTPIGVWTDLKEDEYGLKVKGMLADTPRGREVYTLMKMQPRPAINGLSIGYIAKKWENRAKPEDPRRTLEKIHLMEISLVTFPANGKARVHSVKSIDDLNTLADIEGFLRDAGGLSRTSAKHLVAKIKAAAPCDAGDDLADIATLLTRNTDILKRK